MNKTNYNEEGFYLAERIFSRQYIIDIQNELLSIGNLIEKTKVFNDLDGLWYYHKHKDRTRAGIIYNGFKYLQSIKRLAVSEEIEKCLYEVCSIKKPALVDINCRIDSFDEGKYLFDWHQDYWFSVCSPKAVVVWIPITEVTPEVGGLEIISNRHTQGKIFKTKVGSGTYNTYADAILLDESVSDYQALKVQNLGIGDALFFSFNVMHKSLPIASMAKSRFVVQLRFVDFEDAEFMAHSFKPGVVNNKKVEYLERNAK